MVTLLSGSSKGTGGCRALVCVHLPLADCLSKSCLGSLGTCLRLVPLLLQALRRGTAAELHDHLAAVRVAAKSAAPDPRTTTGTVAELKAFCCSKSGGGVTKKQF